MTNPSNVKYGNVFYISNWTKIEASSKRDVKQCHTLLAVFIVDKMSVNEH